MFKRIRLSNRRFFLLFVLFFVLGGLGFYFGVTADRSEADGSAQVGTADLEVAPVKGALAPDFELQSLGGESVRLSDFQGQPILMNFWATWCGPCRLEMPAIQSRYEGYRDEGLVVLAVNFDESAEAVQAFRDELGLNFPLLLDPGAKVQELYRIRGYPSSIFVDGQGIIQVQHIGIMTEGQLDDNLREIGVGT